MRPTRINCIAKQEEEEEEKEGDEGLISVY
jgi:hypothetical protein